MKAARSLVEMLAVAALATAPVLALAAADVAAPPPVPPAGAAPADVDALFVQKAGQGGLAEVALGKLAQERSDDADVDAFAARMVKDHAAANQKLTAAAKAAGVAVPTDAGPEHKALMDRLGKLEGDEFDQAYGQAMHEDHQKDIALFERQAKQGQVPALREFAQQTLPTLKEHHELASKLPGAS